MEMMNSSKSKKRIVIVAAFLFIIVISCILYFKRDRQVTLKLGVFAGSNWDVPDGNTYQIVDDAIALFEEEHPNVKVVYESGIVKEDYSEWLSEQILLNRTPDVFFVLADDFNMLASMGVMKDLNRIEQKDKSFHKEDYYEGAYYYGTFGTTEGKECQYGLPFESVPKMMFVNCTLLKQEGILVPEDNWTWKDFYDICKQVTKDTDGDGVTDQYGVYGYTWKEAAVTNGVYLFNEDGSKCVLSDGKLEQAVNFVEQLYELNGNIRITSMDFDRGRVAFQPMLFSQYTTYTPYPWKIKRNMNFEWQCISLPAGPNGGNLSELHTLAAGISSRTKETELSWELLKTLCYDERIQREIFRYSQGVSPLRRVTESKEAVQELNGDSPEGGSVSRQFLNEAMENCLVPPKFRKYNASLEQLDVRITDMMEASDNLAASLLEIERDINFYLQEE